ncbi:MAG: hypothetical protein NC548_53280 [Lachnospiraceae bacterium]|nr:hypothetical protein [Lachnospiraceae bacterium]
MKRVVITAATQTLEDKIEEIIGRGYQAGYDVTLKTQDPLDFTFEPQEKYLPEITTKIAGRSKLLIFTIKIPDVIVDVNDEPSKLKDIAKDLVEVGEYIEFLCKTIEYTSKK